MLCENKSVALCNIPLNSTPGGPTKSARLFAFDVKVSACCGKNGLLYLILLLTVAVPSMGLL